MTRDDVIRWAREAGLNTWHAYPPSRVVEQWRCFAALVAAAEREACALECIRRVMGDNNREDAEARRCAAAIRARSTP